MRIRTNRIGLRFVKCVVVCGWAGVLGCGGEPLPPELHDLAPVTGRITFQGTPVPGAVVMLYLDQDAAAAKPPIASAVVDELGHFEVKSTISRHIRPGAAPGPYQLTVSWLEPAPTAKDPEGQRERLPGKFQVPQSSGLTFEIKPGANDLGEIALTAK